MRLNPFAKRTAPSHADVLRAIEATPELRSLVVEAYSAPYDPDMNLSATQGGAMYFRGLLQSARDLPDYDHRRAVDLSYKLADYNPIARRVANIMKSYTVGSGVTWEVDEDAENYERIHETLARFWDNPYNKMRLRLPDRVRALSITGEQCWSVAVDSKGQVKIGYIDPTSIDAVIQDPTNAERPAAVILAIKGKDGQPLVLKCVACVEDPNARGYGRLMAAEEGETYTFPRPSGELTGTYGGSCFFWRVNAPSNASRGRPDILASINWIDAYETILANDVDRTDYQTRFTWDVMLAGADDKKVNERTKQIATKGPPKSGTVNVHNDSETWTAVTPDLHMQDAQAGADLILSFIATGTDLPKTWLNGLMDTNRATAAEMPEPTYMVLEERQTFVQDMLAEVLCFVLDQAEVAGTLPSRGTLNPEPWPVNVTMPELVRKDMTPAAAALQSVVTALTTALEGHIIDSGTAQQAITLALQNFGIEVDVEAMRKAIEDEKAAAEEKAAEMRSQYPDTSPGVADQVDQAMRSESRRQAEAVERVAV